MAAATRNGGIIDAIAADLAGSGNSCVVERHGTESLFEAYERARGVLVRLYLETGLRLSCSVLAAVLASAATGVAFSRYDVRRLQFPGEIDGRRN